jgi:hypothetical protein
MLRQYVLKLRLNRVYPIFIHSIPMHKLTHFGAVASSDRNAKGMTVQLLCRTNGSQLRTLEPTCRHAKLVMKFGFIIVDPSFGGFACEEVGNRLDPRLIAQGVVRKPHDKCLERNGCDDRQQLSRADRDDASAAR